MDKYNMVNNTGAMHFYKNTQGNCVINSLPENTTVTMAYVPFQLDKTSYSPDMALCEGTLFTTLNKPFCGRSLI